MSSKLPVRLDFFQKYACYSFYAKSTFIFCVSIDICVKLPLRKKVNNFRAIEIKSRACDHVILLEPIRGLTSHNAKKVQWKPRSTV